jgi:hypothetical protein
MAEHGSSGSQSNGGLSDHQATYNAFVKGAVALTMHALYVLVALVAFRFVNNYNVVLGFGILIVGTIALLMDARAGNKWYISGGLLVVSALITAVAVS